MNETNELSKFTKFTKFTKYLLEIDSDLWNAFKFVAFANHLKIKEAIEQAITEFIENHKLNSSIEIKIIENKEAKENLINVIYEEEIRMILKELLSAKERKANINYINDLKRQLFDLLKKNSIISKDLADQVKIVLTNLRA